MAPKRRAASTTSPAPAEAEPHLNEEEAVPAPAEAVAEIAAEASDAVQAPAAEAEAEAPAAPAEPVPVTGTTTEMYSQLQSILASDSAKVNDYIPQTLELVAAAESADTPLLLRVRFLELIGQHVAAVRDNNALRKVVTSLVKIVGGPDNTPQLLTAAIQAFAGLGPVSVLDKNWEYLAREGADVLMQVMIDREAFPESVRQAASKSLDSLTSSAFRSVLAKLLHWLSLDREEDEEAQIQQERHMALTRLTRLIMQPSQRKHWTEETQAFAEPLIQRVLGTVDAREFSQLARITAHLPKNQESGNLPMLQWYLAAHNLQEPAHMEAAAIIGRYMGSAVECDLCPALEAAGVLAGPLDATTEASVNTAKVLLLASRTATAEAADKLYPYVYSQVTAMLADTIATLTSANLITVEAILFAAIALARKKATEALQQLNDAAFNATATAAARAATSVYNQVVFAVKKAAQSKEADAADANAVASLHNIKTILEAFSAKRLPLGELKESWIGGNNKIPAPKRERDGPRGAMPPPPGSHAAAAASASNAGKRRGASPNGQDRKRARNDNGNSNSSRSTNNRNTNNNGNNNRSRSTNNHSNNDRRPRRGGRH